MPVVTTHKRTDQEFALFAQEMATKNPNGFRSPGRNGTSLVEKLFISSGLASVEELKADPSPRSEDKKRRRAETRAQVARDRLHGLQRSANLKHGRQHSRRMVYVGPVKKLQGREALVQIDRLKTEIQARFDTSDLPKKYTGGWNEFHPSDFRDIN